MYIYVYIYICIHMYIQFYLLTFEFRRPLQNYMFARLLASTGMTEAELVHLCELAEPRPAWCRSTGRLTYWSMGPQTPPRRHRRCSARQGIYAFDSWLNAIPGKSQRRQGLTYRYSVRTTLRLTTCTSLLSWFERSWGGRFWSVSTKRPWLPTLTTWTKCKNLQGQVARIFLDPVLLDPAFQWDRANGIGDFCEA